MHFITYQDYNEHNIIRRKKTQEEYIEEVSTKHNSFYGYRKVVYTNSKEKIVITCSLHGDFKQRADMHAQGQTCPTCAQILVNSKNSKTAEQFIEEAKKLHSHKNSYNKVVYTSSKKKVIITCLVHGDYPQTPNSHLAGDGCPKCGKESHWRRSDYIKKANGRICTFYTLRCFFNDEDFYKIGVTMNTVRRRYNSSRDMPYNYEIISEIFGEAGFIWDLEKEEKRKLKKFKYQPKIEFGGSLTECFIKYKK